jgi:hypothetical protein
VGSTLIEDLLETMIDAEKCIPYSVNVHAAVPDDDGSCVDAIIP